MKVVKVKQIEEFEVNGTSIVTSIRVTTKRKRISTVEMFCGKDLVYYNNEVVFAGTPKDTKEVDLEILVHLYLNDDGEE